jgi:hypothetical protein
MMPTRKQDSHERQERQQERAVEDSFPASDPPAASGIVGPRAARPRPAPDRRRPEDRPKGTPTDERHATETAYQWEHEEKPPER